MDERAHCILVTRSRICYQSISQTPVEQAMAEGFGTLSTQKQQDARARGAYEDGRWTVVITRPLDTGVKRGAWGHI